MIKTEIFDFDELKVYHPDKAKKYPYSKDDNFLAIYIDDELFALETDGIEMDLGRISNLIEDVYNRCYYDTIDH